MSRRVLIRALAVAVALLFAALVAELVLRLPWVGRPAWRSTRVVEQRQPTPRQKPAFRGARPGPKLPDSYRIVVLGDSFTWGDGVYAEDAYPARLERRLAALDSRTRFDVVSWSRPGWNTDWAWRSLSRQLDPLAPDLLIVGYCINDAEPSEEQELQLLRRQMGVERPGQASAEPPGPSRLVTLAQRALHNLGSRQRLADYYHELYEEGREDTWSRARETLRRMAAAARQREIRHLLVVFPVFDSQLGSAYRYRDLHQKVADEASAAGFAVLDLLPYYQGVDARRLAVIPFTDAHPNELAHRIAADRIVDFLIDQRWVPAEPDALWRLRRSRELMGEGPPAATPSRERRSP